MLLHRPASLAPLARLAPLALLAVGLMSCVASHDASDGAVGVSPDAASGEASAPPDAPGGCDAPTTPVAELDAFLASYTAACVPSTDLLCDPHAFARSMGFAYARTRIASGEVVLDAALAAECVRGGAAGDWVPACGQMLHPRCGGPVGTRCGTSFDCDEELYCSSWHPSACTREGTCQARIAIGAPCNPNYDSCVRATGGVDFNGCGYTDASGSTYACASYVIVPPTPDFACYQTRRRSDGAWDLARCPDDFDCVGDRCVPFVGSPPRGTERGLCRDGVACDAGLTCVRGYCARPIADACIVGDDPNGCGPAPFACVDGHCVATEGNVGDPCDHGSAYTDCADGRGCGADDRCGDRLSDGQACGSDGTTCASGCCASTTTFDGVCVPPAP